MTKPPYRPKRTISIRFVFLVFPIFFIIGALLPAAYFLYMNAVDSGRMQAYERLTLEEARIRIKLVDVLSEAQQLNLMNATLFRRDYVNVHSQEEMALYFLSQLVENPHVSSIYFGNTAGGLVDAGREVETGELYFIETEDFEAGTFTKYSVDEDGKHLSLLTTIPDYDARKRSWYQNAVASEGSAWSDIYTLFTGDDMAIAASHPVYDAQGNLQGVISSDIFLGQISTFLADEPLSTTGQSLLVDLDGRLIASSTYPVLDQENAERVDLDTALAPELNALSLYLRENNIDLKTLNKETRISYQSEGIRYFVVIVPFEEIDGIDWLSIIILPEDFFLADMLNERRNLLYIFAVLGIFMLFLAVHISNIVLKPITSLSHSVQHFDLKKTENVFVRTHFREVNDFSDAFNALVQRLNAALSDLYAEVESHKASKAQLLWSETLYRSVVEDSPGLLCSFLSSGEITFVNKSYAEYYGVSPQEMTGKKFQEFLHEEDRDKVMHEILSLNQDKPSRSLTQRVYLPSGEVRHQRWVNRALFSDSGEIIGYQSFGEDIQQEYQIQQAQSALYRIWRAANRVSDLNDLYPAIQQIVQEIIPTQNFIISLLDVESGLLIPVYFIDENDTFPPAHLGQQGPSAYVVESQKILHCTPEEFLALKSQISDEMIYGTAPKIWLGVPLILSGETIGVMAVQDYQNEKAFGAYEKEFLEMISPSVAATIARRRAEDEIKLYAQTNLLLFNASQAISELLELETIYRQLYDFILEMMPCDFFMISNYDDKKKEIVCEYFIQDNLERDISAFPPLPLNPSGKGTQSRAIVQKKSRLVSDYLAEQQTSQTSHYIDSDGQLHAAQDTDLEESITRAALIVPMFFRGKVSGVIQVMSYQENAYTKNDLHIVEALSSQIGVARNNARLFKQLQLELEMRAQAEGKLKDLNIDLEERVEERTRKLNERVALVENLNTGMSNILHDLKIANERAAANARELHHTNKELEAFSYSVSHDLRAPIRHIESFGQMLQKSLQDRLTESEERYFNNIFTAVTKMRNLTQSLLSLSRASRVDLKLNQLDMNKIIENARAELFDETEGRNIAWTLGTLPSVQADSGLVSVVWANLIGNAVKYTSLCKEATIEIGSLSPHDVEVDIAETHQIFFIRDNGVGFDEAYIDQLFGVFQRLHQGTDFEGTGIGLATVRRIIGRHGGVVWAEGAIDQGATFYFSLPKGLE